MTFDPAAVRQALADAVTAGPSGDYAISAYSRIPDVFEAPAFIPVQFEGDYETDTDGSVDLVLTCRLAVARGESGAAQAMLDTYLSNGDANSIVDAINADSTLGGVVDDLKVSGFDAYRLFDWGGATWWGAELTIEVMA